MDCPIRCISLGSLVNKNLLTDIQSKHLKLKALPHEHKYQIIILSLTKVVIKCVSSTVRMTVLCT